MVTMYIYVQQSMRLIFIIYLNGANLANAEFTSNKEALSQLARMCSKALTFPCCSAVLIASEYILKIK